MTLGPKFSTTNNQQPATNNQQPTTNNRQPTTTFLDLNRPADRVDQVGYGSDTPSHSNLSKVWVVSKILLRPWICRFNISYIGTRILVNVKISDLTRPKDRGHQVGYEYDTRSFWNLLKVWVFSKILLRSWICRFNISYIGTRILVNVNNSTFSKFDPTKR